MDKIKSIILGVAGSIIAEIIILLCPFIITLFLYLINDRFYWIPSIILFLFCLALFVYFNLKYVKVRRIITSREHTMESNTKLLNKSTSTKIYSTRITLWPITESSINRVAFRNALTKKIENGVEVKRLWHIKNKDDFKRMIFYLNKYKSYENYSLKCYIDNDFIMQEIFICHNQSVSISLPQPSNPRMICVCYQYFNKKDIQIWTEYFNLLWEKSIPIFINGYIIKENIKKLNDRFK